MLAEAYRLRARTLGDPAVMGQFFVAADDAIAFDPKAVEKVLKKNDNAGVKVLGELRDELAKHTDWSPAALHALIEAFAQRTGRGMGDVAQPLRVAITGATVSPAIHDTLAILGKESTLKRIDRCLAQA
jgi:glutamyl-tRNA synthetase